MEPADHKGVWGQAPHLLWRDAEARERNPGDLARGSAPAWLEIHRVLADLSVRLVTDDAEEPDIDEAVNNGLRDIGQTLLVDRALVWRETGEGTGAVTTHWWSRRAEPARADVSRVAAIPFIANSLRNSKPVCFRQLHEVPEAADRAVLQESGFCSAAIVPLPLSREGTRAALAFSSSDPWHVWPASVIEQFRIAAGLFAQAFNRKDLSQSLRATREELAQVRRHSEGDGVRLSPRTILLGGSRVVVSESPAVQRVLQGFFNAFLDMAQSQTGNSVSFMYGTLASACMGMPRNVTSAAVRTSRNSALEAFCSINFAASCDDKYCPSLVRFGAGTKAASNACAAVDAINSTTNKVTNALMSSPEDFVFYPTTLVLKLAIGVRRRDFARV